jgi:multidrug efflux pump subunit AcrA (membrane-fusion protein)
MRFSTAMAIISAVILLGCQRGSEKNAGGGPGRGGGGKGGRPGSGPANVQAVIVEKKLLPAVLRIVAPLSGRSQADVFPKVVGRLSSFGAKEGEAVRAGQVLFRVDRNDPGESFLSTPVMSPISGWVGRWYASSVGEQVSTTAPVLTIVDDSILKATIYLPTHEWMMVAKDTKLRAEIAGEVREGRVATIARSADAASGRGSIVVEFDNADHKWRAGMVAAVNLDLAPRERIVIPANALTITDTGAFAYVVKEGLAERVVVSFKLIDADSVEIVSGLSPGDQVITAGSNLLSPKAPVQIVQASDAAAKPL